MNLKLVSIFCFSVFAGLLFRLYHLQVLEGEVYRNLSENNRTRKLRTIASRGRIYDRNGVLLVENRPAYDIGLVLEDVNDLDSSLELISDISEVPIERLKAQLEADKKRKHRFQPLILLSDVNREVLAQLKSRSYKIPGLVVETSPVRTYPFGNLFSQIHGYVREISPDELSRFRPRYRAGDLIGKAGLEQIHEKGLKGNDGARLLEVDSFGRNRGVQSEVSKISGKDLHLTLDARLQKAAADALGERKGAVVAMNPNTGELYALLSRPAMDGNFFASLIEMDSWKSLISDKSKPLENRAIQRLYPPGSTMKLFASVAGLAEGLINKNTKVKCKGYFKLGRSRFRCHKASGHGLIDLKTALERSCNVYYYELGKKLGVKRLAKYMGLFGFGSAPGLGFPGEESGFLPTPEWKKEKFNDKWYEGETISMSIGQGFVSATPLQIAKATAALVNGGNLVKPTIIKGTKQDVEVVKIDKGHLDLVRELAESVVSSDKGSGRRARLETVRVGGKTGTAQVVSNRFEGEETEETKDHGLFTSYAPVENPEIVVVAVVENAGEGGGVAAAPVAKAVLEEFFSDS